MEARLLTVNGRVYRWPLRPVVVVCLDGSAFEYIERAIAAGMAPYLQSLVGVRFFRLVESALPSFTNPNNVSIVTGVPPSVHGIGGNFFLDRETGDAVMMNDASYLRADTILAASRVQALVWPSSPPRTSCAACLAAA
jgi:phosphonoacetate hydrolase